MCFRGTRARRAVGQAGGSRCIFVLTPSQDRRPIDPSRGEWSDTRANVNGNSCAGREVDRRSVQRGRRRTLLTVADLSTLRVVGRGNQMRIASRRGWSSPRRGAACSQRCMMGRERNGRGEGGDGGGGRRRGSRADVEEREVKCRSRCFLARRSVGRDRPASIDAVA